MCPGFKGLWKKDPSYSFYLSAGFFSELQIDRFVMAITAAKATALAY
jgi:hypothetical protein